MTCEGRSTSRFEAIDGEDVGRSSVAGYCAGQPPAGVKLSPRRCPMPQRQVRPALKSFQQEDWSEEDVVVVEQEEVSSEAEVVPAVVAVSIASPVTSLALVTGSHRPVPVAC